MNDGATVLLLAWVVRAALAVLFVTALWHKARAPREFVAALGNYRVLPAALVPAAAGVVMFAEAVVFCHRRRSMLSSGSRSRRFPRWEGPDTGVGVVTFIRAGGVIADIRAPRRPGVDAHPVIVPKVSGMPARVSEAQSEPGSASRPTAPAITTGAMPASEPSASWRVAHACKRW